MATKACYGVVELLRDVCPKCGDVSFIIDGMSACCDAPIDQQEDSVIRICETSQSRRIAFKTKQQILEAQGGLCIYCGCVLDEMQWSKETNRYEHNKIHFDHLSPYAYAQDTDESNLVAACERCNLIKSDKMFNTIEDAQVYILSKRKMI